MSMTKSILERFGPLCPEENIDAFKAFCESLPSSNEDNSLAIVYYRNSLRATVEEASQLLSEQYNVRTINLAETAHGRIPQKSIIVFDAAVPVSETEVRFLSSISSYVALRPSVLVLLTNTDSVPSKTECERNLRLVLEKLNLVPRFSTSCDSSLIVAARETCTVSDNIQDEEYEKARSLIITFLEDNIRQCESEVGKLKLKKLSFDINHETLMTFSNQLPLDVWLAISRECKAHLESDVTEFADTMLAEQNNMVKVADLKDLKLYFASYINYLWGEFLNQETEVIMKSVQGIMEDKIKELVGKYQKFFSENADIQDLKPESVLICSQPVCFDIEHYDYTISNIVDKVIRVVLIHLYEVNFLIAFVATKIYDKVSDYVVRLIRRELSEEKQRNLYSQKIYSQFFESRNEMTTQITDYMMPALEKSLKESMREIIDQLENSARMVEDNLLSLIQEKSARLQTLKYNLNDARLNK